MAQFTIYRSSDSGAPTLDGTVGSLVNLLTTVLTGPSFNGTGFAYGTTPCAGWSRVFTGTDKAVYRPGAGTRFYLRVQDDGPGAGGAKEARVTGYITMIDMDTGTGPFPTAAQALVYGFASAFLVTRKSNTANATARDWIVVADSRTVYVFIFTGMTSEPSEISSLCFGDFYSFKPADAYNCLLIAKSAENVGTFEELGTLANTLGTVIPGHFMARGHTQLGDAVNFSKHGDGVKLASNVYFAGAVPFTNPEDGGIYICPAWISDPITIPVNGCRGRMRGLWIPLHPQTTFSNGDTFSGGASGELAGKTFLVIKPIFHEGAPAGGSVIIETSATLESN